MEPTNRNLGSQIALISGILALAISIATGGVMWGSIMGRVETNEEDIADLQTDNRSSAQTLNQIDLRTARMETKLEILLPTSTVKPQGD